jgi:hypothetical protein
MQVPQYIFGPWHDFYVLIGTASATLIGLMFVAASVGTGVFTRERQVGLRTFLSPTVVAFSVVLASSLIGVLPVSSRGVPVTLLVSIGLLGAAYSWRVWRQMIQGGIAASIDLEDRVWYTFVPAVAYLLLATAGAALANDTEAACALLALGVCLLLLAGIRNAWDMTTWIVLRRQD